jgi:hypothetical protein
MLREVRESFPEQRAKDLISVQPMDPMLFKNLYEAAKSKEELEKEGYRPVSRLGLMWVKD